MWNETFHDYFHYMYVLSNPLGNLPYVPLFMYVYLFTQLLSSAQETILSITTEYPCEWQDHCHV